MTLAELNGETKENAEAALLRCCGSKRWAARLAQCRPFADENDLLSQADRVWGALEREDWLEAFQHHPRIGQAPDAKHASTASWAKQEQSGTQNASPSVLERLARGNRDYEAKFGFVFLVCATGKTADEMLAILNGRIGNQPDAELPIAAKEQAKITRIRLEKLLRS